MAAPVSPVAVQQFLDDDGSPVAGGFLYCYQAGLIDPQPLYQDSDLTIAFQNPLILDAAGRPGGPMFMISSPAYGFILRRADGSLVWSADNIIAPSGSGGSGSGTSVVGSSSIGVSTVSPGVVSVQINARGITYGMMPSVAATRLLGRGSAGGAGDAQELTLGVGISLQSTVLTTDFKNPPAVTLTDAQIKTLPSTGIDIVAAPGAGFRHILLGAHVYLDASGGAYTNLAVAPGGFFIITQGTPWVSASVFDDGGLGNFDLTAMLGTAAKTAVWMPGYAGAYETNEWWLAGKPVAVADVDNQPLILKASNALGNYTGGNVNNILVVRPYYFTIPMP